MFVGIHHTALSTSDLDRLIAFYQAAFGFEVEFDFPWDESNDAFRRTHAVSETAGRVVMLAPPNGGSPLVDKVRENAIFVHFAGPAAAELGTELPERLGPVDFEVGVIAGDRSWNPLGSWLIPGDDDGTVAVESARIEGMADFRVVPSTHTFIMRSPEVASEMLHFLATGRFSPLPE